MLQIATLTGARRGEVAGMTWDELDSEARLWRLPGTRTKNHRDHQIYISDALRAILKTIPAHKGKFVFSDRKNPPSGFSKGFGRIVTEMQKLAKADFEDVPPPWTPHDLRRTFASHVAKLPKVDIATISLCLRSFRRNRTVEGNLYSMGHSCENQGGVRSMGRKAYGNCEVIGVAALYGKKPLSNTAMLGITPLNARSQLHRSCKHKAQ